MRRTPYDREYLVLLTVLKELRQNVGLSQSELARRAKFHQSDVSKVESGVRQIQYFELRRWLAALDFDIATFDAELEARLQSQGIVKPLRSD